MLLRSAAISCLCFSLALVATPALAQGGSCTEVVLSAYSSYVSGIDNAGDVVGYYQNGNGGYDGFLRAANGTETVIDYPGYSGATELYGINNVGQIVGTAGGTVFKYETATQTFRQVNLQGLSNIGSVAINDAGAIAGTAVVHDAITGYILQGSKIELVIPPGATSASATGISNDGEVVGNATLSDGSTFGFAYLNGKYERITNVPDLISISPSSAYLLGDTTDPYGVDAGYIQHGKTSHAFHCNEESAETVALGVNDSRQAVGFYGFIGDEFVYGFIWTPAGG
jgi:probable HAF family extracellular repeat protein